MLTAANHHRSSTLEQALKLKLRPAFTASIAESKNPRFIAINHEVVPCDASRLRRVGKSMPIRVTLIRPLTGGFTSVPYKQGVKAEGPTQRLSEISYVPLFPPLTTPEGHPNNTKNEASEAVALGVLPGRPVMRMWSFKKASKNTDKGARVDDLCWYLEGGNTLILWLDEERMNKAAVDRAAGKVGKHYEAVVPENITHIPAFTVCEVSLSCRSDEYAAKGSAVKIASIRPLGYTLYSCMNDLRLLEPTLELARRRQMELRLQYPSLANDLDTKDAPFWSRVDAGAVLDDSDLEMTQSVRLCNWGDASVPQIDLTVEQLLRGTNTTRVDWACALFEMAIVCGAASVLVFSSDFWAKNRETGFRGIPLIDVEKLLAVATPGAAEVAPLDEGNEATRLFKVFDTDHVLKIDNDTYRVQVLVSPTAEHVVSGAPPASPDFALSGLETELASAHTVVFNLINVETKERIHSVFKGYLNATPNSTSVVVGSGQKRRRFQTMSEN